jgi:DNA end-binding protein Ku
MAYSYKGAITFGLVYIPITLTAAVRENDVGFNMLEKNTMSRVKYKKTCVACDGREIGAEDIIKGFQYEKDKYVTFTDEEFEKLKTPKEKNITIHAFVDLHEIDPIYFDRAYYVAPTGGEKAYAVLLSAMEAENRAGIAKTVLGTKETLIVLRARGGRMLVNTLFFDDEIVAAPKVDAPAPSKAELDLAKTLLGNMTAKFNPGEYKDEYNIKLKAAIQQKIAGKEITITHEKESGNILNIMDALTRSVQMTQGAKPKPQKSKTKKAG